MSSPYPQLTPSQSAKGFWTVRLPFAVVTTTEYTCVAIRSFSDMARAGIDVYNSIYVPVGLIDGVTYDTHLFSFEEEQLRNINIVTLTDNIGNIVNVPDNYILTYPNISGVTYLRYILSADLGPLPSTIDLSALKTAMVDTIKDNLGVENAEILEHVLNTTTNPTLEQHIEFERVRLNATNLANTPSHQLLELQTRLEALETMNRELTQICIDNNYIGFVGGP